MKNGIIVIDIGMTNKKVAVYDEKLVQRDAVYKEFKPLYVQIPGTQQNVPVHDLAGMESWFTEQIRMFAAKYPVQAVSVTTHGATFVCIDKNGSVCAPCIFYTHEPGEQFQNDFYAQCGSRTVLQRETYTPPLSAMINLAKGIRFLQTSFPADFRKTQTILGYPQYWAFKLTGKKVFEPTFTGCHTYLWDYTKNSWSSVADTLGIRKLLPVQKASACSQLGTVTSAAAEKLGLSPSVIVTAGIHDSNASLLPYLGQNTEGSFILNSTGTWCVCMHPVEKAVFAKDDLGRIVFFNRSALDKPVKTAIFLGGMEVDTWVKLYQRQCHTEDFPTSDAEAAQSLINEKSVFFLPEAVPGSGQFPGSKAGIYENGRFYSLADIQAGKAVPQILSDTKRFFAALDLAMVIQTETALRRAGLTDRTAVYTEGGFRKNILYNALLAAALDANGVYLTGMKEATAAGCALSALIALTGRTLAQTAGFIPIERTRVEKAAVRGFKAYKEAWLAHAQ